ncbi:MAG: dienelactone hydrolase family protein [Elusimicrobia bacterium]|nr:dienelactone hydrolase family protein [Elusimicrobiota bacterium]
MKLTPLPAALLLLASVTHAAIKTQEVEYRHGDGVLQGFFAWDDAVKGKRPGVLVIHEWWGHGPYVRRRAEMLAKLGYVAFAADMYGKGVYAKDHQEAGKLSGMYRSDRKLMRERALAGLNELKKHSSVDGRLASIGYCFGGTTSLELARAGADLRGVASFHGGLGTPMPAKPGEIKARVLVLHGADDKFVNPELPGFQEEMRAARADWQLVSYGGAVHSFTVKEAGDDPSKGMAYDEKADLRSWEALKDFLADSLR